MILGVQYEGIPGWFAKKELFDNPYTSNLVWVTKSYPIERGNPIETAKQFMKISRDFKKGRNLSLFPEGTRSKSNKMQPFNPDIFKFIKSLKADIKPIKLDYSVNYIKDDGTPNYNFLVKVLETVPYDYYKDKDINILTQEMFDKINNA